MRDRRKFARYDVTSYPQLKAGTTNGPLGEKLMTISIGGCGFWAPAEDTRWRIGERVNVKMFCEGISSEPFEVVGEVLYVQPHPWEAQIGRFYGIKFDEKYQELMAQILDQLDHLYAAGKIKMA